MSPRVLFLCGHRSRYGLAHLEPLLLSRFELAAVVVATDERWQKFRDTLNGKDWGKEFRDRRRRGVRSFWRRIGSRGQGMRQRDSAVSALVERHGCDLWHVEDVNDRSFIDRATQAEPDLIVGAAYPQILSSALLSVPRLTSVNLHPSALPAFRGAHPHFWAIASGAKVGATTAHVMTAAIDQGDIVAQIEFEITDYDYASLYRRLVAEAPNLIQAVERFYLDGEGERRPQDPTQVSTFRNDREIHHRIFWSIHSAAEIGNLVRTLRAFCYFRTQRIRLLRARAVEGNRNLTNDVRVESGTIVDICESGVVVKSRDACVEIQEVRYEGRRLTFEDWVVRSKIQIGERLD